MAENTSRFHYDGFSSPNGTVVPDDFFDVLAPNLTEAELRVLLYIIRRTFGFKKERDDISLKQMVEGIKTKEGRVLDRGAGVVKSAAVRAVRGLIEKGIVIATRNSSPERGDEPTTYQIKFRSGQRPDTLSVSSKGTRGFPPKGHAPVLQRNTQQTVAQTTDLNLSSIRKAKSRDNQAGNEERREDEYKPQTATKSMTTAPIFVPPVTSKANKPARSNSQDRGFASIGESLTRSNLPTRLRAYNEERQVLLDYVSKFAEEFSDQAGLKTSTSRAYNLFKQSGLSIGGFVSRMHEARAIAKESISQGKKPTKRKMAYFFACLEDRLGLREGSKIVQETS